jgi:hypothetical protein
VWERYTGTCSADTLHRYLQCGPNTGTCSVDTLHMYLQCGHFTLVPAALIYYTGTSSVDTSHRYLQFRYTLVPAVRTHYTGTWSVDTLHGYLKCRHITQASAVARYISRKQCKLQTQSQKPAAIYRSSNYSLRNITHEGQFPRLRKPAVCALQRKKITVHCETHMKHTHTNSVGLGLFSLATEKQKSQISHHS